MSIFLRRISINGYFPFVRLIQIIDNPQYLLHIFKKNVFYKRSKISYTSKYKEMTFLSGQQTMLELIRSGRSLARFSDGEIEQLTGAGEYPPDSDWCQKWSKPLIRDLKSVLSSSDDRLLIAVDPPSTFLAEKKSNHQIRFEYNMWIDMRRIMWTFLHPQGTYGHSHLFIQENCPDLDWKAMSLYFKERSIVIATGNTKRISHLSLGRRTYFVECGTENAYERKELIKKNIRDLMFRENLGKKTTIICACLGPTACIIAKEFLDEGICVWDTGHMFEFAAKNFIEEVFETKEHSDVLNN